MKELQFAMRLLSVQSDKLQVNVELKKFAEEFKYSDPVSNEATKEVEYFYKKEIKFVK